MCRRCERSAAKKGWSGSKPSSQPSPQLSMHPIMEMRPLAALENYVDVMRGIPSSRFPLDDHRLSRPSRLAQPPSTSAPPPALAAERGLLRGRSRRQFSAYLEFIKYNYPSRLFLFLSPPRRLERIPEIRVGDLVHGVCRRGGRPTSWLVAASRLSAVMFATRETLLNGIMATSGTRKRLHARAHRCGPARTDGHVHRPGHEE